ncbi:MAG: FKBP-type peptidyl-prolyl cis-trans isomerase [Tetrasphaera sp.]
MSPRFRFAAPALAAALAVTIAGCGEESSTGSSSSPSAASAGQNSAALDGVKVAGGSDKAAPKVELAKKPFTTATFASKVLKEGTGDAATDKDVAVIDYVLVNGRTGETMDSTYEKKETVFPLSDEQLLAGLRKSLIGAKQGARMVSAIPPADAFGSEGSTQLGVQGTDTLVLVYDVIKKITPLATAEGTAQKVDSTLPQAIFNDGKPATITMPKSDPPKELVVEPLITGKGAKVESGQTALVTYTGALWRDGKVFDSSFNRNSPFPFQVGAGQVIAGWDKGLKGQPVGSRLLLVIPPKEGYGEAGSGEIKGTDTIVFVVDILAAY